MLLSLYLYSHSEHVPSMMSSFETNNDWCHGTVTMSFKCRRVHFLVLIPVLAAFSLATNFSLFVHHKKAMNRIHAHGDKSPPPSSSVPRGTRTATKTLTVKDETNFASERVEPKKNHHQQQHQSKHYKILQQELQQQRRRARRVWKRKKIPIVEPTKQSLASGAFVSACPCLQYRRSSSQSYRLRGT